MKCEFTDVNIMQNCVLKKYKLEMIFFFKETDIKCCEFTAVTFINNKKIWKCKLCIISVLLNLRLFRNAVHLTAVTFIKD